MSKQSIEDWVQYPVVYSPDGAQIFCKNPNGGDRLLLDIRGFGELQDKEGGMEVMDAFGQLVANLLNRAAKERESIEIPERPRERRICWDTYYDTERREKITTLTFADFQQMAFEKSDLRACIDKFEEII